MKKMNAAEIIKGVTIHGLGLEFSAQNTLVIADLHIGYEEALNKQGVLLPRHSFKDIFDSLKPLISERHRRIVVNGDLKHEFGEISRQEWRETGEVLELLKQNSDEVVLVKGNHDTILGPIASRRELRVVEHWFSEGILFIHGHRLPSEKLSSKAKLIVMGHEHPAVTLREGARSERFKCFLLGRFRGKPLIVMPAFSPIAPGVALTREKPLSPLLSAGVEDFEVHIVEKEPYYFGKLRQII